MAKLVLRLTRLSFPLGEALFGVYQIIGIQILLVYVIDCSPGNSGGRLQIIKTSSAISSVDAHPKTSFWSCHQLLTWKQRRRSDN